MVSKASGNGDINAAMMLLVKQMGSSMVKQLAKQDPAKMRQGLGWFQEALTNINDPHVSLDEFRIWANS